MIKKKKKVKIRRLIKLERSDTNAVAQSLEKRSVLSSHLKQVAEVVKMTLYKILGLLHGIEKMQGFNV